MRRSIGSVSLFCLLMIATTNVVAQIPIVLRGSVQLIGTPVHLITVRTIKDNQLVRAKFQVDELNTNNEFVLPQGFPYTAYDSVPYFDANDEVVFMSDQLRPCAEFGSHKAVPQVRKSWLVRVVRAGEELGCVWIDTGDFNRPNSDEVLVNFVHGNGEVASRYYRYLFPQENPATLGRLFIKSGKEERPLISSSNFLMDIKLPWYLPDFKLDEHNFKSSIECWKIGPVRSIVAVGVKFTRLLSLFNLHMFSELVFYENRFQIPTELNIRFDAENFFRPGSGVVYTLKLAEPAAIHANFPLLAARSASELFESGIRGDGRNGYHAEATFKDARFAVIVRASSELLSRSLPPMLIDANAFKGEELAKYWPWLREMPGDLGIFIDISGLKRGTFDFGLDLVLNSKADENMPVSLGDISDVWATVPSRK